MYTEVLNSVASYTEKAQEVYEAMIEILSKNGLSKATINGLCDMDCWGLINQRFVPMLSVENCG